ncbi:MAG TPA: ADOP family duplicated permease, partial [Longimicrobiales bacterium]|nr:ADOP family duplicated permease [Longimicrobiales bacterium]
NELRQAARTLLRQPGLTFLSVLALGLGIGLPVAMFGMVDGVVLRGLPFDDPERIVHLERRPYGARGEGWGVAARDWVVWQEQQRSFEQLAAFRNGSVTLRSGSGTDRWRATWATPDLFPLLRVRAAQGRAFGAEEAAAPVVLLGHHVWRDRFASEAAVIGSTVFVDGRPHTVLGVMPETFRFPDRQDVWLPLPIDAAMVAAPDGPTFDVIGRLRPGVSRREAAAELDVVARRLAQRYPESNANMGVAVKSFAARFTGENASRTMLAMLGAVLLVLVVACVNVANLLLVRAVHRSRDLAIVTALGASRARVVRQVLLEALLLAALGGALGTLVAALGIDALAGFFGERMPLWMAPRLDARVLGFMLALVIAGGLLAGLLPALKATHGDLTTALRDDSRGATGVRVGRVMHLLVILELALSLGLLVPTALLARSAREVQSVELGFSATRLYTARAALPDDAEPDARRHYHAELAGALAAEPGIAAAALATTPPADRAPLGRVALDGVTYQDDDEMPVLRRAAVSPEFFTLLGTAPVRGRAFTPLDGPEGAPVAIVNARAAARLFPGEEAIGRRVRTGGPDAPWRTIVGVVPDLWMGAFDAVGDRNPAGIYLPLAQEPPAAVRLLVRARGADPAELSATLRRVAFAADPEVPVYDVRSMRTLIEDNNWFYGMGAGIMAACGAAALLLAAVGLYGVIAFSVERRRREFGVRMAIGARAADIVRLVVRRGTLQLAIGTALGALLAVLLGSGMRSLLFEVSATDPLLFAAAAALLIGVGLIAMLLPALRAARGDPLDALRAE